MLILKLALVPAFLAMLTFAGRIWGPSVAGWLAGLPVVSGPIVLLLALDRGPAFAAHASAASIAAIAASEAFNLSYAWASRRRAWPLALVAGCAGWSCVAVGLARWPAGVGGSVVIACIAVAISQTFLPRVKHAPAGAKGTNVDLVLRMVAGAALTLAVTALSASLGAAWSGVLSVFPLLGIVLAVSTQRAHGADPVALLMRGMVVGRASFAAFFVAVVWLLPSLGIVGAFAAAAVVSVAVQGVSRYVLRLASHGTHALPDAVEVQAGAADTGALGVIESDDAGAEASQQTACEVDSGRDDPV
ncbi:hypothetical protein [Paraburkholderia phosphatilytica]|uniref:hypothetical protein n=1 Tax=Paraburkholderia phosphatilytica TaxID=2282883 RepID=UPI001F0BF15D|nr:hypothetical protein [Paraburkholderia phosphatilytica]